MEIKCVVCQQYFVSRTEKAMCCSVRCYAIRRKGLDVMVNST